MVEAVQATSNEQTRAGRGEWVQGRSFPHHTLLAIISCRGLLARHIQDAYTACAFTGQACIATHMQCIHERRHERRSGLHSCTLRPCSTSCSRRSFLVAVLLAALLILILRHIVVFLEVELVQEQARQAGSRRWHRRLGRHVALCCHWRRRCNRLWRRRRLLLLRLRSGRRGCCCRWCPSCCSRAQGDGVSWLPSGRHAGQQLLHIQPMLCCKGSQVATSGCRCRCSCCSCRRCRSGHAACGCQALRLSGLLPLLPLACMQGRVALSS